MCYQAEHHVKIAGRVFAPGEQIDMIIPSDKLDRLLSIGALTVQSAPKSNCSEYKRAPEKLMLDAESAEGDTDNAMGDVLDAESAEGDTDDEPALEIDISDGIVERSDPETEVETIDHEKRRDRQPRKARKQ